MFNKLFAGFIPLRFSTLVLRIRELAQHSTYQLPQF